MSIAEQIQALEELASTDAELKILDDEIHQDRSALGSLKTNLSRLEEKLKVDRAHVQTQEKARTDLVIELRNMMQQLDHSREKLNRSRTERESNAAQRELEELRKLVRDREDEVGKITTEVDALKSAIDATETEARRIETELSSQEGDITTRLSGVEARRAQKQAAREALVKKLPSLTYKRYDTVRVKRGTGLAATSDGLCKACHMRLPPQLFHKLRREPLIEQCPSCNRLIYYAPESKGA